MTDARINRYLGVAILLAFIGILFAPGCAQLQAITPVERPPAQFQTGRPVFVEFVKPETVMGRCFQRGVLIPADACADRETITIANPCATNESYANRLCHELAHVNGWDAAHSAPIPPASESPLALAFEQDNH